MMGLNLGRLGIVSRAIAEAWTPAQLWPLGASSPGLWIDPPYTASLFSTSAGTTAISAIGTVLDTSNPVGLALDRKGNLELGPELVTDPDFNNPSAWTPQDANWVVSGGVARYADGGLAYLQSNDDVVITSGKTYKIVMEIVEGVFTISPMAIVAVFNKTASINFTGYQTYDSNGVKEFVFVASASTTGVRIYGNNGGLSTWGLASFSVKEIPGMHLSQATGPARPVASARKNLLVGSNNLLDAAWSSADLSTLSKNAVDHNGAANSAWTMTDSSAAQVGYSLNAVTFIAAPYTASAWFAKTSSALTAFPMLSARMSTPPTRGGVFVDTTNITVTPWTSYGGEILLPVTGTITEETATHFRVSITFTALASSGFVMVAPAWSDTYSGVGNFVVGATGTAVVDSLQLEAGSVATTYQRFNTLSDYDASAGPTYLKFDGVDDSLASAAFAAGTLTSSMDCLIAVRRDSTANVILVSNDAGAGNFFGCMVSGAPQNANDAGTSSTIWVDGTQLSGGTSVTRGTLEAAVTVGSWHIVEFRGLDLSIWTRLYASGYSSFQLNGALGGIQLFASGQDANRDLARAQMAAYFGVTLP